MALVLVLPLRLVPVLVLVPVNSQMMALPRRYCLRLRWLLAVVVVLLQLLLLLLLRLAPLLVQQRK